MNSSTEACSYQNIDQTLLYFVLVLYMPKIILSENENDFVIITISGI